jgi:NADPH:quinone reductase-like Zn-dependent oxidoreductase
MEGRIVIVATMSGAIIEKFSLRDLMNKRLWVMTTTLRTRPSDYQKQLRDVVIEKALPYFAKGEVNVSVDEVFPWTEIGMPTRRWSQIPTLGS